MSSLDKQISGEEAAKLFWIDQPPPPLAAQLQDQVEKTTATPTVVIIDDDSDDNSDAFGSCDEDYQMGECLDAVMAVHENIAWEAEEAKQRVRWTEECMLWSAGLADLPYWKHEDPRTIDSMKTKAENLTEDDRREFDDRLCGYYDKRYLGESLQEVTRLLFEADPQTLAKIPSNVLDMRELIKDYPQRFYGMDAEIEAFRAACNAWEQRRSAKGTYVPKAKKAKHNGPSSSPSFSHSFISDYASEDQMEQIYAMSLAEEMEHNQQMSDEAGRLRKKLTERDLVEVQVPAVGNCVFEAMAKQADVLLGIDIRPQKIRKKVARYIQTHKHGDFFDMLMDELVGDPDQCYLIGVQPDAAPEEKWKAYLRYIEDIEEEGHYGGPIEILAFARMYGCTATVVSADMADLVLKPTSELQTPHVAYFVFYKTGRHYNPAYLFH